MNKITNYILLFFLFFLSSCAYEPILKNKNYQFSINLHKINGDQKINTIIINKFNNLKENECIVCHKTKLYIKKPHNYAPENKQRWQPKQPGLKPQ